MSIADFATHGAVRHAVAPQTAASGTINGVSLDCKGYRWANFILNLGASGGGLFKIEQSDDQSTWVDIKDDIQTPGTTINAEFTYVGGDAAGTIRIVVDSQHTMRYLRAVVEPTGATDFAVTAVMFLAQDARFYITDDDKRGTLVVGHNPNAA